MNCSQTVSESHTCWIWESRCWLLFHLSSCPPASPQHDDLPVAASNSTEDSPFTFVFLGRTLSRFRKHHRSDVICRRVSMLHMETKASQQLVPFPLLESSDPWKHLVSGQLARTNRSMSPTLCIGGGSTCSSYSVGPWKSFLNQRKRKCISHSK